ncbi:hypothetical protein AVEN_237966-1, partial [Araneus ventricosus]
PHPRRIFGGIEFRPWSPPVSMPSPYHQAMAALPEVVETRMALFTYDTIQASQSHDTTLHKSNLIGLSAHMIF